MTPVERRRVLESVAGVTSYDDEIKKADRQKKQVEDYIDRISLLEEEQKNRLKDLKKEKTQAEKAVEVKQLHDEAQSEYFQSKYASMHAEIAFSLSFPPRRKTKASGGVSNTHRRCQRRGACSVET